MWGIGKVTSYLSLKGYKKVLNHGVLETIQVIGKVTTESP